MVLSCIHCNKKKKDTENIIFTFDLEAYPNEQIKNEHTIYNVGLCEYEEKVLNDEKYDELYSNTIIFYGEDDFFRFENWLNNMSEKVRQKVDRLLNYWLEWYEEEHLDADEKMIEKAVDKKRKELIRAHKIIIYAFNSAKYDNNFVYKS
jgi:deoxyhypusine synthase